MKSLKEQVKRNCVPRNKLLDDDDENDKINNIEIKPSLPDLNLGQTSLKNYKFVQKSMGNQRANLSASQTVAQGPQNFPSAENHKLQTTSSEVDKISRPKSMTSNQKTDHEDPYKSQTTIQNVMAAFNDKDKNDLNLDKVTPELAAKIVKHFVLPMFDNAPSSNYGRRIG